MESFYSVVVSFFSVVETFYSVVDSFYSDLFVESLSTLLLIDLDSTHMKLCLFFDCSYTFLGCLNIISKKPCMLFTSWPVLAVVSGTIDPTRSYFPKPKQIIRQRKYFYLCDKINALYHSDLFFW